MSKAKMQAAKELIEAKQYDEARSILKTIDHPTARFWLAKLDALSPVKKKAQRRNRLPLLIFAILLLIVATVFTITSLNQQLSGQKHQLDNWVTQNPPP